MRQRASRKGTPMVSKWDRLYAADKPHGLHRQTTRKDGRVYCHQCRMIATGTFYDMRRYVWVSLTATWVDMPPLPIVAR